MARLNLFGFRVHLPLLWPRVITVPSEARPTSIACRWLRNCQDEPEHAAGQPQLPVFAPDCRVNCERLVRGSVDGLREPFNGRAFKCLRFG